MGGILGKLARWSGEGKREFCAAGKEYLSCPTRPWHESFLCLLYEIETNAVY